MRLFSRLFDQVMTWARHPRAPWYLGGVSFAESSFFPIPPDVMLAPMVLARPDRAWSLALLTTVTSVLGAVFGYLVGMWAIDLVMPVIDYFEYGEAFIQAQEWFDRFGFFAILAAAFSPIPYKMFTISAGVLSMALLPFIAASFIGRGLRFFLVAALVAWIGPTIERHLKRYMDILGWLFVLLIAGYLLYATL